MSTNLPKPDFAKLLAGARLPERTVEICLRADLVAEHETLDRQLVEAQRKKADSLAGSGAGPLVERITALEAEMRESTYPFRLRALHRHAFRDLMNAHEPRRDDKGEILQTDRLANCNTETMFPELIRRCVVDPQPTDAEWDELLDTKLTDAQYNELAMAAWNINQGAVDVPFSLGVSLLRRSTSDG